MADIIDPARAEAAGAASARRLFRVALLAALAALALIRQGGLAAQFVRGSLQLDFSAYYTAAEASTRGLTPYENHIERGLWDGICRFRHSRFLYPPLVARLLRPLAALPYHRAKALWTMASIAAVGAGLGMAMRLAG